MKFYENWTGIILDKISFALVFYLIKTDRFAQVEYYLNLNRIIEQNV